MHTVATYELVAGERYEIELAPIPAGHALLLRLDAPVEEEHVAYRLIDAGCGATPGFAAVRFWEPSTYSTASGHDRLSNAISESRSLNTSGHSIVQRRLSSAPAPGLHVA